MFKPLLKVIPSLSGNMKIVCPLEGYVKRLGTRSTEFDCVVNTAYLNTISNALYDKNINLNLKNNSFEYDVNRFYKYYSDVFYKTCFNYSKVNIPILDETSVIYQSNSDFEFGCKRVSYIKSKNVFGFFAPIYIEGLDDIKNKVFRIKCTFRYETNEITKYINIPISKIYDVDNKEIQNSLGDYLERYAQKINDNVVYFSTSYKNIYYGIDLKNGGFVNIEDNISKNLFKKYYTINDFDCIINKGFQRNNLMMKQVLALSFYFDPENLLNDIEKKFYKNTELYISGSWYDNGKFVDFYNFSDNYHKFSENIYKLNTVGMFKPISSSMNIMDVQYPGFNEGSSTNYQYVNTISKNYNRWKLKYSSDDLPYIINNNYAFSFNQNSLNMYKEFPLKNNTLSAICKLKSGSQYNMLIDFENIYNSITNNLLNNIRYYYNTFNKHYISNFFNIVVKEDFNSEKETQDYINIFDPKYGEFWGDVNKDGKIYYKGILYDLNNLYKNNSLIDSNYKIDKFGIFVEPHFTLQDVGEYNNTIKYAKNVSNVIYEHTKELLDSDFYKYFKSYSREIRNNILVKKVNNDDNYENYYYDLYELNLLKSGEVKQQLFDINLYYDLNDIYILLHLLLNYVKYDVDTLINDFIKSNNIKINNDYKIIECYNINNIYSNNYKTEENYNSKLIYRQNKFLEYEKIYWAKDKLYFSIYPNSSIYSLLDQYELFEKNLKQKIVLYYKSSFIKISDLDIIFNDLLTNQIWGTSTLSIINILKNILNTKINKYYYINGLYDKTDKKRYTNPVYKQLTSIDNNYGEHYNNINDDNVIYIDPYNLENIYNNYVRNSDKVSENFSDNFESTIKYCRFFNSEHINYYLEKLYNDEKNNESIFNSQEFQECSYGYSSENTKEENISGTIYIRTRNFNNITNINNSSEFSTIVLQDEYIPIRSIGFNNIGELLNVILYDDEKQNWYFDNELYNIFIEKKNAENKKNNKPLINKQSFISFELFFKKKMFKLNKALYNVILNLQNNSLYKDLYLYHMDNQQNYNINFNYNIIEPDGITDSDNLTEFINNISFLNSNICDGLYPYFNKIYEENNTSTKIYSDYFINNITESIDKNGFSYYRYNEEHINMLVRSNQYIDNVQKYIIINGDNDSFCSYSDLIDKFDLQEKSPNGMEQFLNSYNNLCTYTYNGINYGFYYINTYFSNTSTYLNLKNEEMNYIDYISYINDIDVSLLNKYSYSYLLPTYRNILPYMNNNNITNFLFNNSNIVIKPVNLTLTSIYKQYPNYEKNNKIISYTIYNIKKEKTLELTRYFDNIIPYIYKETAPTSYYLYFKKTDNYSIENSKILNNEPFIIHEEISSIYKNIPVKYFSSYTITYNGINTNIIKENEYTPLEYKYYNDNKYYFLNKYFEIKVLDENNQLRIFNEKQMIEFENNKEEIIKLFSEQLKSQKEFIKEKNKDLNILFLYKKYKVEFDHNFIGLENETNNRLYQIKIKFSLL